VLLALQAQNRSHSSRRATSALSSLRGLAPRCMHDDILAPYVHDAGWWRAEGAADCVHCLLLAQPGLASRQGCRTLLHTTAEWHCVLRNCCCCCACLLVHWQRYSCLQEHPMIVCCQHSMTPYLVHSVHPLTVHQNLHSSTEQLSAGYHACCVSCLALHAVSQLACCVAARILQACGMLACMQLQTPTVLHLRPSGPVMLMGADQIQMPRVQDWCVGDTTKPLGMSTLVNLLRMVFSRKLLPCLARPHTDTVQRGPGMVCRTRIASCPTSQLLVASLKPISSSGLPCAACALLGSAAGAAAGVLVLLNQLEAMSLTL
jgi:hypothetical protein